MKSLSNTLGLGQKRLSNISKLRAQEVYYNNATSGLTGTNVQEAIDELASGGGVGPTGPTGPTGPQATPLADGRIYGYSREVVGENTTVLGYNSIPTPVGTANRIVVGKNSFPDLNDTASGSLVCIGNNICELGSTAGLACHIIGHNNCTNGCGGVNTIIGFENLQNASFPNTNIAQNIIIGSDCLKDNNNSILSDNYILGNNNLSVVGPDPNPRCQNNLILGKNITYANSNNHIGNIEIGSNIATNTNNSIIIHPSTLTTYNSTNNGVFYLGKDNIANWPNADNQFVIDNGYTDYKIYGVTGPFIGSGVRILHYDETTGRINYASPENASVAHSKVLKLSPTNDLLFRTIRGDTGITVVEETDSILIYGSTGGSAPSAQPTTEGSVFGLTRPIATVDGCTFLGYDTCTSYAAQTPNANVADSTVIGTFNLSNLDQTVTNLQNNVILGHSLLPDVSSFSQIAGNFIVGGPVNSTLTQLNSSNLIGMGSNIYDTLLNSRSLVANVNMLSSNQNTFASGNLTTGIVILGNSQNLGVANKSICVGTGSSNQMNSLAGIVFNQGLTTYNNNNFENCCAFIGVNPADATNDDQFIISHTELLSPNLGSGTPAGNGQRLLYYDPTSGLIRPASTSGAYKRVSSYTGNTDSAGQIVFNLAPLSLSSSPIVSCSVRNTSQVNWFNCHVFSLSSTSCSVQVFQNGTPAGSNITVHLIVTY